MTANRTATEIDFDEIERLYGVRLSDWQRHYLTHIVDRSERFARTVIVGGRRGGMRTVQRIAADMLREKANTPPQPREEPRMQKATLGRIVHYTITENEASKVNNRRFDGNTSGIKHDASGAQVHTGNHLYGGETFPAIVVRENDGEHPNLQVFLDGNDTLWVTSAHTAGPDDGAGWAWPVVPSRPPVEIRSLGETA